MCQEWGLLMPTWGAGGMSGVPILCLGARVMTGAGACIVVAAYED